MGPIVCVCVCVCVCVSLLYTLCIALCVAAIRLLEMSREVSDLDRICEERSRHSWLFPNHSPSKRYPKPTQPGLWHSLPQQGQRWALNGSHRHTALTCHCHSEPRSLEIMDIDKPMTHLTPSPWQIATQRKPLTSVLLWPSWLKHRARNSSKGCQAPASSNIKFLKVHYH